MKWQEKYEEWKEFSNLEPELKNQLATLTDATDLEDRFYQYLDFGTGGMRGELGLGINRMNIYVIKRVSLGLSKYILEYGASDRGVVISYDNRHKSVEFAEWTARILASQGIKVYLSDQLRPTPELSFLIRHYQAFSGVMITASHNPKEYNGFKIYGEDGGQITLEAADRLGVILSDLVDELSIEAEKLDVYVKKGIIEFFSEEADGWYLEELNKVIQNPEMLKEHGSKLNIIYTPLHGAGRVVIEKAFKYLGMDNLYVLEEQALPDPDFPTVQSPNPEEHLAFELALVEAAKRPTDLIIATDPDADRLGAAIIKDGVPNFLNGNQIGVLLLDYLINTKNKQGEIMSNYFLAKTIVTSDLGAKIAHANEIETRDTLTGFKFIGEQIELSEKFDNKKFIFGYEESYGYLIAPFVRDKDAIQAAVLLAEVTLDCYLDGIDLIDRLNEIYEEYGYYEERLETKEFFGKDGIIKMTELLESLRRGCFSQIGDFVIASKEDYLSLERFNFENKQLEKIELPQSNVLKYIFTDKSWVCVRPSGTEPKFKIYYSVNAKIKGDAINKMEHLQASFAKLIYVEDI